MQATMPARRNVFLFFCVAFFFVFACASLLLLMLLSQAPGVKVE